MPFQYPACNPLHPFGRPHGAAPELHHYQRQAVSLPTSHSHTSYYYIKKCAAAVCRGKRRYLPAIERRGLEIGLLCLTFSVLVPFASGRITTKEIAGALTSWPGWIALAGGAIATYVNGKGLEMLKFDPQLIVGLVIGSILGIVFFRGIPVGPLMAAGITAILYKLLTLILERID